MRYELCETLCPLWLRKEKRIKEDMELILNGRFLGEDYTIGSLHLYCGEGRGEINSVLIKWLEVGEQAVGSNYMFQILVK
jgi:hypothetical protein